ncbi:DUF3658 domain-containing protein [Xanthomonas oryzae pv. oryzae]|uniref:DUF3658 domain-containing protein n=2 Tax=Xanthomonas oryzae TaxID=347 RepID=A0A854DRG6_XANOO|nr:DUF3658 domain-containing protein [Xanthomonas oryzae]AJQ84365.1 hypothetical protein AZ54_18700 [Xanthomonas oryzae pv. oryzae PXO86]ALZ73029.1 hypothetical protein APZ20_17570 [Xanthomonas oryzae pv. oryzae]AOS01595.1 hypothetical protein ATY42_05525 [Xanthomonas oryzae pv. oryzae]AOS07650.1 hypothetical protein ATY43_18295 [Xanthomonas oryzae pv. oryzae]AOS11830.1 hypothetical protein ATY44_17695 [Xanthomonas oryzae pv. oryzae]
MDPAQQLDDPPLDAEELEAAASLTSDDIQAIDCALIAASRASWSKVALVVSVAMDAYPDAYCDIPDIFYAQRIRYLVSAGHLEASGNLNRMRFSEVRLSRLFPEN